jgi:hypothetical protein
LNSAANEAILEEAGSGGIKNQNGGIAQLGERLHGMQEVSGSIPLTSTKFPEKDLRGAQFKRRRFSPLRLEA